MGGWFTRCVVLAGFGLLAAGCGNGVEPGVKVDQPDQTPVLADVALKSEGQPDDTAREEAVLVAEALAVENAILKEQLGSLRREVEALQVQLAEAMVHVDLARMRVAEVPPAVAATRTMDAGVMVDDLARVRILDVNRDQQVAVVSGGMRAGMKVGMRFHILREERIIAQLRLIDVRETVAGGLIERVEKNVFPESGDRLILSTRQDG
jgi:hypothetical protein